MSICVCDGAHAIDVKAARASAAQLVKQTSFSIDRHICLKHADKGHFEVYRRAHDFWANGGEAGTGTSPATPSFAEQTN
jgi:hypothetical protein